MSIAARTAIGRRRTQQDRMALAPRLIVVADGMGGRPGGGQAAQVAVAGVLNTLAATGVGRRRLEEAIETGNQAVRHLRLASPEFAEAATTLTVVAILHLPALPGPRAVVGHVGDSPVFLIRGSDTTLLTRPHTVAEDDRGENRTSSPVTATTLTRHLGSNSLVPELQEIDLDEGDRLLVATDGLLDGTDPRRIRELATADEPVDVVADNLLAEALRRGSDNVTVVVVVDPFDEDIGTASSR